MGTLSRGNVFKDIGSCTFGLRRRGQGGRRFTGSQQPAEQLRLSENVKPNQCTPEVRRTRSMFLIGLN